MKRCIWRVLVTFGIAAAVFGRAQAAPNILLIIADDMGVETLASYGLGENPPTTAALDELARDGVRFNNFWTQPVCSPTRATMLTGRYGFRTGIGRPTGGVRQPPPPEKPDWASAETSNSAVMAYNRVSPEEFRLPRSPLSLEEFTLPTAFKTDTELGYATAAIGKWHLGGPEHPNLAGFDHFSGLLGGSPESYFAWNHVVNGEFVDAGRVGYAATDKVDDALTWLGERDDNPWFLWFAFNTPHTPLHLPPAELWQSDYSHLDPDSVPEEEWHGYFSAMIEAMDTEIARLLSGLAPDVRANTYVIFMGDNGTHGGMIALPFRDYYSKGEVYEGGVNVPLIVTGPGVAEGGVSEALINSTDVFSTIMEMAGVDPAVAVPANITTDSISFLYALSDPSMPSAREWIYVDEFFGGFAGVEDSDYAMRNHRYKLVRHDGVVEFYDLEEDPYEHKDLLEGELSTREKNEYQLLMEELDKLRSSRD